MRYQLQPAQTAHSSSMWAGSLARVAAAARPARLPLPQASARLRALASSAAEAATK